MNLIPNMTLSSHHRRRHVVSSCEHCGPAPTSARVEALELGFLTFCLPEKAW